MGDAWYAISLVKTDCGEQGSRRHKENPLPFVLSHFIENVAREGDRTAAAAASAGIGVLFFVVVDLCAAVHVLLADIIAIAQKHVLQDTLSDGPQIPGDNLVIIIRLDAKIFQIV